MVINFGNLSRGRGVHEAKDSYCTFYNDSLKKGYFVNKRISTTVN